MVGRGRFELPTLRPPNRRVSACKADVLSGGIPNRAELPALTRDFPPRDEVDYDLGRNYSAFAFSGA